jgi:hypothetical protein
LFPFFFFLFSLKVGNKHLWEFRHEKFRKGERHLLVQIKRKTGSRKCKYQESELSKQLLIVPYFSIAVCLFTHSRELLFFLFLSLSFFLLFNFDIIVAWSPGADDPNSAYRSEAILTELLQLKQRQELLEMNLVQVSADRFGPKPLIH